MGLKKIFIWQGEENTRKHEEKGEVVMVTEHRELDGGNRKGQIVIRVSMVNFSSDSFIYLFWLLNIILL